MDAKTGVNSWNSTYGAAGVTGEVIGTGDDATTSFTANVNEQVRPRSFTAVVGGVKVMDDGEGVLLGNGATGTINYESGVVTIDFMAAPASGASIAASYEQLIEAQEDVAGIAGTLASTDIRAEVFALKSEVGILQEYSFSKRFGRLAMDEVAQDLTAELTRVTNTAAIQRLNAAAVGLTTWDRTAPNAVSYAEHCTLH